MISVPAAATARAAISGLLGHGSRRVGIDEKNAHEVSLPLPGAGAA